MVKFTTYSRNQAHKAKILLFSNFSYVEYTCTNGIYIERIVDQTFQCSLVWISLTQIKILVRRTIRINILKSYKFSKDVCKWTPRTNAFIINLPSTITIILQKFSTPWHHCSLNNSTLNLGHLHEIQNFPSFVILFTLFSKPLLCMCYNK
jgi:hypothetical protein